MDGMVLEMSNMIQKIKCFLESIIVVGEMHTVRGLDITITTVISATSCFIKNGGNTNKMIG